MDKVSYNRINWKDGNVEKTTPINAENLNKMDKGLLDLATVANNLIDDTDALNSDLTLLSGRLPSAIEINYTDSTTEDLNHPEIVLQKILSRMPSNVFVCGRLNIGSQVSYYGMKTNDNYASFIVHGYYDNRLWHIFKNDGTWFVENFSDDYAKDYVKVVHVTFNNVSIGANSSKTVSKDVSSFIPSGYKLLDAYAQYSGSSWFFVPQVAISGNKRDITVYIRNTYSGTDQGQPIITLLCIRDV